MTRTEPLPIAAVARRLGVNPATVFRWIHHGVRGVRLDGVKLGGRWRVSEDAVDRFSAATTADARPVELEPAGPPRLSEETRRKLTEYGY